MVRLFLSRSLLRLAYNSMTEGTMMLGNRDLADLCRYLDSGRIDRREFFRNALVAGASVSLSAALAAVPSAVEALETIEGPEKRAWELAKSAAAKAPKKTLTVLYPSGAVGNLSPYVDLWKKELGIEIELIEEPGATMHAKGMQEAVTRAGRYDVIQGTSVSLPDWADAGAILDLTDFVEKYKPDLFNENWGVVPPAANYGEYYKGRIYALWYDNDEWTLLLRSDYLSDPAEKEKFNKQFGYDLAVPDTWKQYDDQAKFFHRPEKKFFGSLEYRSRFYVKWVFMQRFASKGKVYFDADMNCQFELAGRSRNIGGAVGTQSLSSSGCFQFYLGLELQCLWSWRGLREPNLAIGLQIRQGAFYGPGDRRQSYWGADGRQQTSRRLSVAHANSTVWLVLGCREILDRPGARLRLHSVDAKPDHIGGCHPVPRRIRRSVP